MPPVAAVAVTVAVSSASDQRATSARWAPLPCGPYETEQQARADVAHIPRTVARRLGARPGFDRRSQENTVLLSSPPRGRTRKGLWRTRRSEWPCGRSRG